MNTEHREGNGARRVMIVDDDGAVRQSLSQIFDRDERFAVVSEHGCAKDAIHKLNDMPTDQQPHLVLLDISMPGMDGIECCSELRTRFPGLVIAMFTGRRLASFAEAAREAGADAYFCKTMDLRALVEKLAGLCPVIGTAGLLPPGTAFGRQESRPSVNARCLLIGPDVMIGGAVGGATLHHNPRLSPRQEEIMEFVAQGFAPKEIAALLGLSSWTIYSQLHRAEEKLRKATLGG